MITGLRDWKQIVSQKASVHLSQVETVWQLKQEGATLPFIARYRREQTGNLDELQLRTVFALLHTELELHQKKQKYLEDFEERKVLTPGLKALVIEASDINDLLESTRDYRSRRETRADMAVKAGLLTTVQQCLKNKGRLNKPLENTQAKDLFVALAARELSLDSFLLKAVQKNVENGSVISRLKRGAQDDEGVYDLYHQFSLPVSRLRPHQTLAIQRGVKAGVLSQGFESGELSIAWLLKRLRLFIAHDLVRQALHEAIHKILRPAQQRIVWQRLLDQARGRSMEVFARNVRAVMLAPPNPARAVLAIDPGFAAGCKCAVVDSLGHCLEVFTIYPHPPRNRREAALQSVEKSVLKHKVERVVCGNGTASRETREWIADLCRLRKIELEMISEAGASVWSTSEQAAREFPDLEAVLRGAVSIARRSLDPLGECVRIPPQALGVGMYQHDLAEARLEERLEQEVESVAAFAGANLNTTSLELLRCIPGIGPTLAQKIVEDRRVHGPFGSRKDLLRVKGLGEKTWEQCIGFLRVLNSSEPLDATGVHPRDYELAKKLLASINLQAKDVLHKDVATSLLQIRIPQPLKEQYGEHQIAAVLRLLGQAASDPRAVFASQKRDEDRPAAIEELTIGMQTWGVVRNIVDFGAFLDLGLKSDGLLHRSRICRGQQTVESQLELGQVLDVEIEEVDPKRGRIALKPLGNRNDEQSMTEAKWL